MKNDINDIAECPICKRVLLRNARNFYKKKTMKSGFDSKCKRCRNKQTNEQKAKKESPRKKSKPRQYRKYNCLNYDKCLLAAALINKDEIQCENCSEYEKVELVQTSSYQNGYELHLDIDKEL